MAKCAPGCTCGHHRYPKCEPGCTCGKHSLRNSGQFAPGHGPTGGLGGRRKGARGTPDERFNSRIAMGPNCCHIWTGAIGGSGYGTFWDGEKYVGAHAYADDRARGCPLPPGLNRDHICRVRRCVNPAHIERVTPAENSRRAREAVA